MCDEINAQICNGSHELVLPTMAPNIVGCKWIFTLKYLHDGFLDRYKARLVARGFHQQSGRDFTDTFSLVIKSTTVRSVLQVEVNKGWNIKQIDVNNAFLQGPLHEEVYVAQPPGFVDPERPHYVCRLKKALYGLKQAPRAWYQELRSHLLTLGFVNLVADTSLFIKRQGREIVYILVYIDDMVITGSNSILLNQVISSIAARFSLKNLGELRYFLGREATRTSAGLHLMQQIYIVDLLTKTQMLAAKSVSSPMSPTPKFNLCSGNKLEDPLEYRARCCGKLTVYILYKIGHRFRGEPTLSMYASTYR